MHDNGFSRHRHSHATYRLLMYKALNRFFVECIVRPLVVYCIVLSIHCQESGIRRVWCHKGLVTCLLFAAILIAGLIVVELKLPDEGFRLSRPENLTECEDCLPLCFVYRTIRSVGMMGLLGMCVYL